MNMAKSRDRWLIALLAAVVLGFGYTQATAERKAPQETNYTFAFSSGPGLQLVGGQDEIPAEGTSLVCERIFDMALASLGHNCRPTIKGVAAINLQ